MFLSQNRAGQWVTSDELTWEENHPVVYSALHTHANYASAWIKTVATLDLWPGVPYLNVLIPSILLMLSIQMQTCFNTIGCQKRDNALSWRTWNNASGLQFVTGEEDWLGYKGHLGIKMGYRDFRCAA